MHFFVVTYEFIFCPFSGNGILARSLVNSLLGLGHFVSVWCAKPSSCQEVMADSLFPHHDGRLKIFSTTVDESKWKVLDENSAWDTFAYSESDETTQTGLGTLLSSTSTSPIIPVVVDWHGSHAYQSLPFAATKEQLSPLVYMNFRVYAAGIQDKTRHAWLNQMEQKALQAADKVIALSQHDRALLEKLSDLEGSGKKDFEVFYPPLRKDIQDLGTLSSSAPLPLPKSIPSGKQFVTCVVRLSPEKETLRFIPFLQGIRDVIESKGLIPVLVGSPSDKHYSKLVRDHLKESFPNAIDLVDTFLSPNELCAIFQNTVINFHPCSYDAYGMTIVEAAAMGVPSVIANNGQVGASHLIGDDSFVPMEIAAIGNNERSSDSKTQQQLRMMLEDDVKLLELGKIARERALAWNEGAYGSRLVALVSTTSQQKICA